MVQLQAAKLGVVTGRHLAQHCRWGVGGVFAGVAVCVYVCVCVRVCFAPVFLRAFEGAGDMAKQSKSRCE